VAFQLLHAYSDLPRINMCVHSQDVFTFSAEHSSDWIESGSYT